jgi:hypothetical protein
MERGEIPMKRLAVACPEIVVNTMQAAALPNADSYQIKTGNAAALFNDRLFS